MIYTLPWPPSVNTSYRAIPRGKIAVVLMSKKGREYRKLVMSMLVVQGAKKATGRLKVSIDAYAPDKRRRDLDNHLKALLDALEHGGAYENDSQIDDLRIIRRETGKPGHVDVTIEEIK